MKTFRIHEDYEVCYPNPLLLSKGDLVTLDLNKKNPPKWDGWYWAKANDGNEGWISISFLDEVCETARLKKNYTAKELAVSKNVLLREN